MLTRRGHHKRSSEGDIALVQMQIAAQARNQRWHDFLCEKRDELQARLRQQGYSQSSHRAGYLAEGHAPEPALAELDAHRAASRRWGIPAGGAAPEAVRVPGVQAASSPADEGIAQSDLDDDDGGGAGVGVHEIRPDGQQAGSVGIGRLALATMPGPVPTDVPGADGADGAAWWDEKDGDPL